MGLCSQRYRIWAASTSISCSLKRLCLALGTSLRLFSGVMSPRRWPRVRWSAALVVLTSAAGLLASCAPRTFTNPRATPSTRLPPVLLVNPSALSSPIPEDAETTALQYFEGRYGSVTEIYATGSGTLSDWRTAEPGNTSGLETEPDGMSVYSLFVRGTFEAVGPPAAPGEKGSVSNWDEGRVTFDSDGRVLHVRLWVAADRDYAPFSSGSPAFDPAFDG